MNGWIVCSGGEGGGKLAELPWWGGVVGGRGGVTNMNCLQQYVSPNKDDFQCTRVDFVV